MSAILSRLNKKQGSANNVELALKVKAEIIGAFMRMTTTEGRHLVRQVGEGARSAQFPTVGRATGQRHTPGHSIFTDTGVLGTPYLHQIPGNERIIAIDRPIVVPNLIDLHDESMSAYDYRSEYVMQHADFLARAADLLRLIVLGIGASAAANITGGAPHGTEAGTTDADSGFDADAAADPTHVLNKFVDANATFLTKHVPKDGSWVAYMRPTEWALIWKNKNALDRIVHVDVTGAANGGTTTMTAKMYADYEILVSTNMPNLNYAADPFGAIANEYAPGETNDYVEDLDSLRLLFGMRSSIGTAVFGETGIGFESEYELEYRADAIVSMWAAGCQYLRPEACYRVDHAP